MKEELIGYWLWWICEDCKYEFGHKFCIGPANGKEWFCPDCDGDVSFAFSQGGEIPIIEEIEE
jgi:hypothetical protein